MRLKISSLSFLILLLICLQNGLAQKQFSLKDSLRGSLNPSRMYDVKFYDLSIEFDIPEKKIQGICQMNIMATQEQQTIQVDLFENLKVDKVLLDNKEQKFSRLYNTIQIPYLLKAGAKKLIEIHYSGKPIAAKRAPWDGGFTWQKDKQDRDWIAVSCEGIGASLWWPNKDHLSDEPDSMKMHFTVPENLVAVSNGNLLKTDSKKTGTKTYHWAVSYPINNYNVTFYIGHYQSFKDSYSAQDGQILDIEHYVLDYNLDKAKNHFKQTKKVLEAFEFYLGKYPFWRDGFSLVEAPYAGMEHQSAIAYGNGFQRGYYGALIPDEFDFDYIILHESGHEYFGNSVSCNDIAEMWIHESFTTYLESLFIEYYYGKSAAVSYLQSQRSFIANKQSIVRTKGVNDEPEDSDQYYKGAWMLQSLRKCIDQDSIWFGIIKEFYHSHALSHATTEDFINLVNQRTKKNFTAVIHQYLNHNKIPVLEYKIDQKSDYTDFSYRWVVDEKDFSMPVWFKLDKKVIKLEAGTEWQNMSMSRAYQSVEALNKDVLIDLKLLNN